VLSRTDAKLERMGITPEQMILDADNMNVRLEFVRGVPLWEASPVAGHQLEIDRIQNSIKELEGNQTCIHLANTLFKFVDGSLTAPDIAILCQELKPEQLYSALEIVPEAVVEVISEGYEYKDLEVAPSFYLGLGVKDVLILEPRLKIVYHHRKDSKTRLESPVKLNLECGCEIEV
jgi:Uma2 family endonuclease